MEWNVTRDHCGPWSPELVSVYIVANVAICMSYLFLVFQLFVTVKVKDLFVTWSGKIKILFGLFILSCGIGHFFDGVLPFFWPYYPLFTAWHVITAILSVTTAALFPRMIIQAVLDQQRGNNDRIKRE